MFTIKYFNCPSRYFIQNTHWMYARPILLIGCMGITLFYSIRFYQKQPKELLDYSRLFLVILFLSHYIVRVFHLSYDAVFQVLFQISLVFFLILYLHDVLFVKPKTEEINNLKNRNATKYQALSYLLYGIAAIGIVLGSLFKILHWEFDLISGNILLSIGLFAAASSLFFMNNN